ncbi:hypothetical protein GCM10009740_33120 [Terrabacter terrae]|uniref:PRC-barrel domain containing protein n=1 Tax=Terrabacter terrae TaxID=318434 RepID=A0ABP5G183_9MICO
METDVVLRLLDHQLVGPDGSLLGNVDDLELVRREAGWFVTGVQVGPAALSRRLPGLLGRWVYAVWHRLHPAPDPSALVVPLDHVTSVDSAVHVDDAAARALSAGFGVEHWLRDHVVSRLPGSTGPAGPTGGSGDAAGEEHGEARGEAAAPGRLEEPQWPIRAPLDGAHPLSRLLGRTVLSYAGTRMGRVCELRCLGPSRDQQQGPLRVRWLLYTPRLSGWQLGYSTDPRQGPWLVRRFLRSRRHRDRIVELEQVQGLEQLEEPDGELVLTHSARPGRLDDPRDRGHAAPPPGSGA